ncbi:MAG: FAD-dependent monooxygenase, partial [Actinomycetota bacterium]|nr:FAD-dependent monooxygenase [Actinomycetota bacterium]
GGLFLAARLRSLDPSIEVDVFERNGRDDTFGFGVVFSDETLDGIAAADPTAFARMTAEFRSWGDIDVHHRGQWVRSTGHGFSAVARLRLLQILAERAVELGARVHFERPVSVGDLDGYDVVVAADGVHSATRVAGSSVFRPSIATGTARFIWLGTRKVFDAFTFLFAETAHGVVQAHCYPYDEKTSTVIVEMDEATWRRSGLDATGPLPPGESDEAALTFAEEVFGHHLDGEGVIGNASVWRTFPTVRCSRWHDGRVVLLGDAVHTAHFSVGSGTKLALEDAIALADAIVASPQDIPAALDSYQEVRAPAAASLQRAADTSADWFSSLARYVDLPLEQFVFQLLTRSQRITYDNLELRDPALMGRIRTWFHGSMPASHRALSPDTPPMFYPYTLRELRLDNRVVVSPMAQYSAVDGIPDAWHLVHLGSRAVGGAGLVMTEMTCVAPEGRITPGCTGLWNDTQQEAWEPIVDFVHRHTPAKIGLQLGHAGRKGSVKVPWEGDGDDEPLDDGNWQLLAPSPIPWDQRNQVPMEMTDADMETVVDQHVAAARRGAELGFDLLELHFAHGYLLSSFLCPLSNLRRDGHGGSAENRLRYPLRVVAAVRAVWPDHLPLSVRFSATDWMPGGNDGDDAVAIAAALAGSGADIVDVSTGQVHPHQQPRYGRLYQTPFSDRIRQEVGIPTMTVGAVSSIDDVNTILVSGRADLCLLARSHLVDPYWTLNAAIDLNYPGHRWPVQYLSGRTARRRAQDPLQRLQP